MDNIMIDPDYKLKVARIAKLEADVKALRGFAQEAMRVLYDISPTRQRLLGFKYGLLSTDGRKDHTPLLMGRRGASDVTNDSAYNKTGSNAGWRVEKDRIVGGYVVYCGDEPVTSCPSKKDAAEIVENARATKLLHAVLDNQWFVEILDVGEDYGCWTKDHPTEMIASGPTPIEAIKAALATLCLKGAGS